jgi:hypothetical protein
MDRGSLVLLGSVNHILSSLLVNEKVHMVTARLISLLKLPVEDLRVIHSVATLQGTHSHHFVYVIETLIVDLRNLIFFNENL